MAVLCLGVSPSLSALVLDFLLGACPTVLPGSFPPCCLFDLITKLDLHGEKGWATPHSKPGLPSFCVINCTPASSSFIKRESHLLHHFYQRPPFPPSIRHNVGVNCELSPDRHQESHQTPVGPRHRRRCWRAVTHKESGARYALMPLHPTPARAVTCTTAQANSRMQSRIIIETLMQRHNKEIKETYLWAHAYARGHMHMHTTRCLIIWGHARPDTFAPHTHTRMQRHHLQSKGRKSQERVLSSHTKMWQEHSHTYINNKALMHF